MNFNWYIIFIAALIPMIMGFIWYNPKTLGAAWMKAADMTEEKMKGANMAVIFGLSFVFSFLISALASLEVLLFLTVFNFLKSSSIFSMADFTSIIVDSE